MQAGNRSCSLNCARLIIVTVTSLFALSPAHAKAIRATVYDYVDAILLGGETTVIQDYPTAAAFDNPAANLSEQDLARHLDGDQHFSHNFTDNPSRPDYGLGPAYNNTSCSSCHTGDGRGNYPSMDPGNAWTEIDGGQSIFLRMSLENSTPRTFDARDDWGAPIPVPGYGLQLFQAGSYDLRSDSPGLGQARVWMKFEYSAFTYPDGTTVNLRKPIFKIDRAYDAEAGDRLHQADVRFSPRQTPPMIGLGLLEAVRESDILTLAGRDLSRWGIHGHPNWVLDKEKQLAGDPRPISLGRFGLKANTPTVFHQALGALNGDLGVTSPAFPQENIFGTNLFDSFIPHWTPRVDSTQDVADALVFYSSTIAVPSRRDVGDPDVRAGAARFTQVGCANCHQPSFITGPHKIPVLAGQKIYPFTDMLLHDMGDGLADGRTDFHASGREWRTRPLWGIGDTLSISMFAGFLHDGRASTLEEAILWHDGEARVSRDKFAALTSAQRDQLIAFLNSL